MIKMQIIGNLGGDATVNEVNGKKVINFNVAHSEKFKNAQGDLVERTTWVRCAYWTDRAVAPYLLKGQLVYAEGNPEVNAYMNKDNQAAASLQMRLFQLQLLGSKSDNAPDNSGQDNQSQSDSAPASVESDEGNKDDLPF